MTITDAWVVIDQGNYYWTAAGDHARMTDWVARVDLADRFPTRQEAKSAYRATHGSVPRRLRVVEIDADELDAALSETSTSAPGGLTDRSPGQTDRVAAIVARNNAAAKDTTTEVAGDDDDDDHSEAGTVVEVIEAVAAELVPTAQELDAQIRATAATIDDSMAALTDLIHQAQSRDIHTELGFTSWTAYVADVMSTNMPKYYARNVDARQAMVAIMTDAGVSVRVQAEALGTSKSAVSRDQVALSQNGTVTPPATVTSKTGRVTARPDRKQPPKPEWKPGPVAGRPWVNAAIDDAHNAATPEPPPITIPTTIEGAAARLEEIDAEAQQLTAVLLEYTNWFGQRLAECRRGGVNVILSHDEAERLYTMLGDAVDLANGQPGVYATTFPKAGR